MLMGIDDAVVNIAPCNSFHPFSSRKNSYLHIRRVIARYKAIPSKKYCIEKSAVGVVETTLTLLGKKAKNFNVKKSIFCMVKVKGVLLSIAIFN